MGSRRVSKLAAAAAIIVAGVAVGVEKANAAYSVNINSNTLTVTGDGASDTLALRLSSIDASTLLIDVGNNGTADFATDRNLFTQIVVNAGGGNDTVLIDQTNGVFTDTEATTLNGGGGNDTLTGGSFAETLIGGDNNDTLRGGAGNDIALLGTGADTFIWNPGDRSDTVDGQNGEDLLAFNGANIGENISLARNGTHLRLTRDVGMAVLDVNNTEAVALQALGGADNITVDPLGATDVTRVDLELESAPGSGTGDGSADTVTVNGSAGGDTMRAELSSADVQVSGTSSVLISHPEVANDAVNVNPLAGNDNVRIFPGVSAMTRLNVDGGSENDTVLPTGTGAADDVRLAVTVPPAVDISLDGGATFAHVLAEAIDVQTLNGPDTIIGSSGILTLGTQVTLEGGTGADEIIGTDGPDTILGGDGDDTITGGNENDFTHMGPGNDTFGWNPGDDSDTIEGESGTDLLAFRGANISEDFAFSANGGRLLFTRNVANIVMDTDDVETVSLQTLGGTDNVTVNPLGATDVTRVGVELESAPGSGTGDGAADTVTVNGNDDTLVGDGVAVSSAAGVVQADTGPTSVFLAHSEIANDALSVNPLAGPDEVAIFPGVTTLIRLNVDGGTENDTVFPTGTGAADDVRFAVIAAPTIDVSLDGGATFAHVLTEKIDVQTLGGPDTIIGINGILAIGTKIFLEGGPGPDQITGTDANDIIIGEDGDDTIIGRNGDDLALMGSGNDTFIWNPGDDNDTVEGQSGADVLTFNGANILENIELSPNGERVRFTRDIANVTLDTNDVERIDVHALGGADKIVVNDLTGTDVTRVDAELESSFGSGLGDAAMDSVTVNGTAAGDTAGIELDGSDVRAAGLFTRVFVAHSEAANDTLAVNTFAGDDSVTASAGLAAKLKLTVDGGLDADTIQGGDGGDTLVGGDGNDTIRGMDGNDSLSGGPGTDFMNGGPGADTFSCGGAGDTLVTDAFDTIGPDC
jgi:Ca2+-binding RTX toxin-like protein